MSSNDIRGVRGNHDQQVLQWKGWVNYITGFPGGKEWLIDLERKSEQELRELQRKSGSPSWKQIPVDWEFMGDHYRIARCVILYHFYVLCSFLAGQ